MKVISSVPRTFAPACALHLERMVTTFMWLDGPVRTWFEFPFVAGTPPGIPVKIDTSGYKEIRKEPMNITSENTSQSSSFENALMVPNPGKD